MHWLYTAKRTWGADFSEIPPQPEVHKAVAGALPTNYVARALPTNYTSAPPPKFSEVSAMVD